MKTKSTTKIQYFSVTTKHSSKKVHKPTYLTIQKARYGKPNLAKYKKDIIEFYLFSNK